MHLRPLPTTTRFLRTRRAVARLPSAAGAALAMVALVLGSARAELPSDVGGGPAVATLTVPAPKHWVWVNDFVFPHMADGMAYLVDGDTGRYLGTLSTGYSFAHLNLSRDGKLIYSPETYFSRGTRGKRTDVVTLYDPATLGVVGEIPIPPKRSSNLPMAANNALTDDDRFLLIYNFNPAQSVTVVDTKTRKFVREIETPGCALVYPTGPRSFFSVCGDGSLLLVGLDDAGAAHQKRTQPLLSMGADPVTEKAVHRCGAQGRLAPRRRSATRGECERVPTVRNHAPRRHCDAQGSRQGRLGVRRVDARAHAADSAQALGERHPALDR